MIKTVILSLLLVACMADDHDTEFDYYDINHVYNQFHVSCGSPEKPYMRITYGGNAYSVYAAESPECKAKEVAPAVFLIHIGDYSDTNCPVRNVSTGDPNAPVRMLDVVVQEGTVRKWTDMYKQITCNYGLGGQTDNHDQKVDANEGSVEKRPVWQDAVNRTAVTEDTVHLHVYGTSDQEIEQAVLGEYIQLRAFLASDPSSAVNNSIKIFNCRAFDEDLEYYFLTGGCGEGDVMGDDRGFRTQVETVDAFPNVTRVSRSTYFKSFLLPDKKHLTFECDYILCNPSDCDGYSCENSIMHGRTPSSRRKRRAVDSSDYYSLTSPADEPNDERSTISSKRVKILPQENSNFYRISSNDLVHSDDTPSRKQANSEWTQHEPQYTKFYVPEPTFVQETYGQSAQDMADQEALFGLDMMTIGLITGMSVLGLLLIVAMTCMVVICRRTSPVTHAYYHRDASMSAPLYTGSPKFATPYKA